MVVITVYWIYVKFQLHNSLLAFHSLEESYTEENLGNYVIDMVVDFNLCENLFCITIDNTSNKAIIK